MYSLIRPLLFCMNPEASHNLVLGSLAKISRHRSANDLLAKQFGATVPSLPLRIMGLDFPNPVGLAAGLDKQGNCANALSALGFGWVELGTVTPLPQPGNPKPRMFRLIEHQAIINRMGFNSIGLDRFLNNINRTSPGIIKGINIGKNASTPVDQAPADYLTCLDAVYSHADYITINISSPNTSNLRNLQQNDALDSLLEPLNRRRQELCDQYGRHVPLVLKIAPDLDNNQVNVIAAQLRKHRLDGVAATNTTVSRDAVSGHRNAHEDGGLSGPPVRDMSTIVLKLLYKNLQGEIPIIGIGGIDSASAAIEKFEAGADLVQLYTGFIYKGPKLIKEIVFDLSERCGSNDFGHFVSTLRQQIVRN